MDWQEFAGMAPFAVITALVTWAGTAWKYRDSRIKEKAEQTDRIEMHRDDLTFDLLKAAREEIAGARIEMVTLRDEVKTLRALEQHFYHFQQALEHLEAVLYSGPEKRIQNERAAKAFLQRMKRLQAAKGTIANESQRAASAVHLAEGKIEDIGS